MTDAQTESNNRLGALWDNEGERGPYISGHLDPSRWDDATLAWVVETLTARERLSIVVFRRDKSRDPDGSRRPDWDIVRKRAKGEARPNKFTLIKASGGTITDSDIPF